MSQTWATTPERGTVLGIRIVLLVSRLCGYRLGMYLLYPIVFGQLWVNRQGRMASEKYLHLLGLLPLGASKRSGISKVFRHQLSFAINAYDRVWFAQDRLDLFDIQLVNHELVASLAASGRGAIVISCHMGSFDIMRSLSRNYQVEVVPVMYGASSRKFLAALEKVNPAYHMDIIYMDEHGHAAAFMIQDAVEKGKIVAIMGDRIPAQADNPRVVKVPFLGNPAPFNLNPWVLASALKCPVLFAAGIRTGFRQYRVFAELMGDPLESNRRAPHHGLGTVVEDYAKRMELLCRKHPYQWFNFFDFWSHAA